MLGYGRLLEGEVVDQHTKRLEQALKELVNLDEHKQLPWYDAKKQNKCMTSSQVGQS